MPVRKRRGLPIGYVPAKPIPFYTCQAWRTAGLSFIMPHGDLSARKPVYSRALGSSARSPEDLTAHFELLCSDPADLAGAIVA